MSFRLMRRHAPVALTMCVGVAVSIVLFSIVRAWEQDRIEAEFERRADNLAAALTKAVDNDLEVAYSISSLYAGSQEVTRHDFREAVKGALSRHDDIQALEWIPRVLDSEREAYEAAARQDGYPDFQIAERATQGHMVRAAQRAEYFPVYYVEPYEGNEVAFGFDLASDPTRLEALDRARDTGEATATARITLVQETSSQFGFLFFVPIYRSGLLHATVEERRENLSGFALAVFRTVDMVEAALESLDTEGIDIQLVDETAAADEGLLYSSIVGAQQDGPQSDGAEEESQPQFNRATTFRVADRLWSLQFSPTSDFGAQPNWQAWGVLGGGLLVAGLLTLYLLTLMSRTARIEQRVAERTAELEAANTELGREITQRKRAEEALQRAHDELEVRVKERTADLTSANEQLEREITERKQAEEALRESESKYRTLLENLPQKIFSKDKNSVYVSCNDNYARDLNIKPDEIVGKTDYDFYPKELAEKYRADDNRIMQSGRTEDLDEAYVQDGQEVVVHTVKTPLRDREGNVVGILGVFWDITERKQMEEELWESEARYKALFAGAPQGMLVADSQTRQFRYANPAMCMMFGYTEEELLRLGVADIHPKESLDHALADFEAQARGEKPLSPALPCLRKDGTLFYADIRSIAIVLDGGKCSVGIFSDVTERKKMEEERERLHAELQLKAITDSLTGLYNHAHFYQRLSDEIDRSKRYRRRFALAMMDVDNFKHYNDSRGHQAGDDALCLVGACIRTGVRRSDIAFRYGGDEFAAILLNADPSKAQDIVKRINMCLTTRLKEPDGAAVGWLGLSAGVACFPEDGTTPDDLVRTADISLYDAKRATRARSATERAHADRPLCAARVAGRRKG